MIYDSGNPIEPPPPDARDKTKGRAAWGFPADRGTVLLVYGGSQGSQAINSAVADWVRSGFPPDLYLIWGTGTANYDRFASLASDRIKVRPYLSPIGDAYRAADLAVSRAGAMATAELCAWGIPMILVPLPTAAADHQTANARALEAAGAAHVIVQSRLLGGALATEIAAMISEPGRRSAATEASLRLARPRAAEAIANSILDISHIK
jgi:UDP-N-acetylglucosamine--N-acetylmuramyl-(pentapeptide) pyrophosphoryl-undecaprenol N-acetylglucosamine transferase